MIPIHQNIGKDQVKIRYRNILPVAYSLQILRKQFMESLHILSVQTLVHQLRQRSSGYELKFRVNGALLFAQMAGINIQPASGVALF